MSADPVVIVSFARTPMGGFQGALTGVKATALGSAAVTPLLGASPLVSFELDLVWFAYAWALGRAAIMLAALDTGSAR